MQKEYGRNLSECGVLPADLHILKHFPEFNFNVKSFKTLRLESAYTNKIIERALADFISPEKHYTSLICGASGHAILVFKLSKNKFLYFNPSTDIAKCTVQVFYGLTFKGNLHAAFENVEVHFPGKEEMWIYSQSFSMF